jgi:hypothetical protein
MLYFFATHSILNVLLTILRSLFICFSIILENHISILSILNIYSTMQYNFITLISKNNNE